MTVSQGSADASRRGGSFPRIVAGAAGAIFLLAGLWGFFDQRSFFDSLAVFEPFNRHFIRDIGAFQVGLGAVLLMAIFVRDALLAALTGVAAGATLHVVSHLLDREIGGDPARDIPFFGLAALALVAAAIVRARAPGS